MAYKAKENSSHSLKNCRKRLNAIKSNPSYIYGLKFKNSMINNLLFGYLIEPCKSTKRSADNNEHIKHNGKNSNIGQFLYCRYLSF